MVSSINEMDRYDWIAVGVAIGLILIMISSFSGFVNLIENHSDEIAIECNYWIEDVPVGPEELKLPSSIVFFQGTATNMGDQSLFVFIDIILMTSLGQSYEESQNLGLIEPGERHGFFVIWLVSSGAGDYNLEYEVDVTASILIDVRS